MRIRLTRQLVFAGTLAAALFVHADTAVRHVAMTGSDENDGLTVDTAFKTVARAVTDLGPEGGDVYVEAGTYTENRAGDFDDNTKKTTFGGQIYDGASCFIITNAIKIIGVTGDPEDVIISSDSNSRVCYMDCADAMFKDVTLKGKTIYSTTVGGGTLFIGTDGGVVDHCIVEDGCSGNKNSGGGNIYMKGGRVMRSIIRNGGCATDDYYRKNGANVYMTAGVVENSLITGAYRCDGPVVINGPGSLVNCTVAKNYCGANRYNISGVKASENAHVVNCVIFGNTPVDEAKGGHVWSGSAKAFVNCIGEVAPNDSCFAGKTIFKEDSFELAAASPALDKGTDYALTDAISEVDIAGNQRVQGSAVDLGCYEREPSEELEANFSADISSAMSPCDIVFTADILNAGENYTCKWDFDADGIWDAEVENSPVYTWHCTKGGYKTVKLRVESDGSFVEVIVENIVFTYPKDIFVNASNGGSALAPYDSMETAAPSILAALEFADAGSTIHVADGLYPTNTPIVLSKAIRLESISGDPSKCIISNTTAMSYRGANRRNIQVSNAGAVVSGFTFANGSCNQKQGAAINMSAGLVTNCVIVGASNQEYDGDAAVYLSGGTITHCVIHDCQAPSKTSYGYAVAMSLAGGSAKADNCLVYNCGEQTGNSNKDGQNIVRVADKCQARNLTVVNCRVPSGKYGINASSDARVYNCVAANIVSVNGDVTTCRPWGGTASRFYNCAFDAECAGGSSCVFGTAAEFFKDAGQGKFEPKAGGPLVNAGNNDYVNSEIDLAGMPRILSRTVDIGCYESPRIGFNIIVR